MKIHIIQHVSFESPGSILEWAENQQATISYTNVFNNDSYPSLINFDLLVVMGGPMSANDDLKLPWISEEKKFISNALAAGAKILGVCLGSQLLAAVLRARVYANAEKEIGWWPIQKANNNDNELLTNWPDEWHCFHWHGDTYDLPEGATRLFKTAACHNQGYLYKKQVLALQFHMEATPELVADMTAHGKDELVPAKFIQDENTILNTASHYEQNRALLYQLLDSFIKL